MNKLVVLSIFVSSVAFAQPKKDPKPAPKTATGTLTGTVKVTDDGKEVKGAEIVVYVVGPPDVLGKENVGATITQTADRKFIPDLVAITQNERVAFPNTGLTLHNVFSPKPKFDLGSFEKGKSKDFLFKDYKGTAEIYCNIHPEMAATILVLPNPYHASVKKDGTFEIPNVPVGKATLFAYTRRATAPAKVAIDVAATGTTANLTIPRSAETKHVNKYGEKYKDGKSYP